jgi:enamine deaminase RidA (YjgF/YER057c/UK114 family)
MQKGIPMAVTLINPDGVFKPDTYFQVGVATGSSIVCLSGQIALDAEGNLIGPGDLAAQSEQVYRNIFNALKGVGASFADVVKLTVFIPNYAPEKMSELVSGATKAAQDLGFDPRRPITLVGVAALGSPELLVEVEAMAVLSQ